MNVCSALDHTESAVWEFENNYIPTETYRTGYEGLFRDRSRTVDLLRIVTRHSESVDAKIRKGDIFLNQINDFDVRTPGNILEAENGLIEASEANYMQATKMPAELYMSGCEDVLQAIFPAALVLHGVLFENNVGSVEEVIKCENIYRTAVW